MGSTRIRAAVPAFEQAGKDVTRDRPEGVTPSKRNSESSERPRRDRSVNGGLRTDAMLQSNTTQMDQRRPNICRYIRERSSNQCSTG